MMRIFTFIFGCGIALSSSAYGASDRAVSQVADYDEFTEKFCSVSRDSQHIFVLPITVFKEQKSVSCADGESKLRTSEPEDDPGHIVLNIDPPHGSKASFDCDGKADIDMTSVAINCLPVSQETEAHPKE